PYFTEAIGLARELDDRWRLVHILTRQASAASAAGDPKSAQAALEARELAEAIGDRSHSLECGLYLGWALLVEGRLDEAVSRFREAVAELEAARTFLLSPSALMGLATSLAYRGEFRAARDASVAAVDMATDVGDFFLGMAYAISGIVALAGGELALA